MTLNLDKLWSKKGRFTRNKEISPHTPLQTLAEFSSKTGHSQKSFCQIFYSCPSHPSPVIEVGRTINNNNIKGLSKSKDKFSYKELKQWWLNISPSNFSE